MPLARDGSSLCFAFGCTDGSLHVYRQTSTGEYSFASKTNGHSGAVEDLAFDPTYNRLASAGGSQLVIWNINPQGSAAQSCISPVLTYCSISGQLVKMAIAPPRDSTARSVKFCESGMSVLVAFLQSHEM